MDIVDFREYCLSLPEVEECLPFDDVTLVFKVAGRMFTVPIVCYHPLNPPPVRGTYLGADNCRGVACLS